MKALAQASLFVVFAIVAGVVGVVVWVLWEVGNRAINALDMIGPGLFEAGALVTFGVFVFLVVGGAVAIVRWLNLRSRAVHHDGGLFPVMYHHIDGQARYIDVNAVNSQVMAVMHMNRGARAGAASVNAVLSQPAPVAEIPAPVPALTPSDVVDVDPRVSPHWLLIGSSGSGKSNASYRILGDLVRRNPTQVVITEPGGVGWGAAATATDTRQIAQTIIDVQSELERRQSLLRAADVDHVQDLPEPLPYLVLVCEETETVLDDLKMQDRELRTATVIALRSIARLGRKAGVCLVAITQAGSLDVFDGHIRKNITNTLIFRSEHTVGETWRLGGARLQDLAPGQAYSVRHSAVVSFPMTARPVLQLAQPTVEAAGIPVDNWPGYTGIPLESTAVPAESGSTASIPVFNTDDRTAYTEAQIAHIQALYGQLGSIKAVERNLYGQDGGYWFYRLKDVLS